MRAGISLKYFHPKLYLNQLMLHHTPSLIYIILISNTLLISAKISAHTTEVKQQEKKVELDESFPQYILSNKGKLKQYLL